MSVGYDSLGSIDCSIILVLHCLSSSSGLPTTLCHDLPPPPLPPCPVLDLFCYLFFIFIFVVLFLDLFFELLLRFFFLFLFRAETVLFGCPEHRTGRSPHPWPFPRHISSSQGEVLSCRALGSSLLCVCRRNFLSEILSHSHHSAKVCHCGPPPDLH